MACVIFFDNIDGMCHIFMTHAINVVDGHGLSNEACHKLMVNARLLLAGIHNALYYYGHVH